MTTIETYYRDAGREPLLTADEERDLARRIASGDMAARDRLIRANMRLVVKIARGYRGRGIDLADLIGEGNLGLIRAATGYDPDVGTRFSTYADYWIRMRIGRSIADKARTIRRPAYLGEILSRWDRISARLGGTLGRPATDAEIVAELGVPVSQARLAIETRLAPRFLGQPADPDATDPIADAACHRAAAGDARSLRDEAVDALNRAIEMLTPMEREVIRARYPPEGKRGTLASIGLRFGLTAQRINQIEFEARSKLRILMPEMEECA